MPGATLAAIVISRSVSVIDVKDFSAIRRVPKAEFHRAVAATIGAMLVGTPPGILAAGILSVANLLHQANDPPMYVLG